MLFGIFCPDIGIADWCSTDMGLHMHTIGIDFVQQAIEGSGIIRIIAMLPGMKLHCTHAICPKA